MKKFIFYFFIILPFAKCNLEGLNIRLGTCPVFTGANNLVLQTFAATPWTVASRSTNFFAGQDDCENHIFILNQNNNLKVFDIFSNPANHEFARTFVASAFLRGTNTFQFIPNSMRDNYVMKGGYSILGTNNISFAVAVQCFEVVGYRFIIIFVLIKGTTPPPNLNQMVNAVLAANNLALNPPLQFTNLQARCIV